MKALTIRQPWASLVGAGHKTVENRSWSTNYRGPLAIHAGLAVGPADHWALAMLICKAEQISFTVDPTRLPRGGIIAVVELIDVVQRLDNPWSTELPFQWVLQGANTLSEVIPCRGAQGLWDVSERDLAQIEVLSRG